MQTKEEARSSKVTTQQVRSVNEHSNTRVPRAKEQRPGDGLALPSGAHIPDASLVKENAPQPVRLAFTGLLPQNEGSKTSTPVKRVHQPTVVRVILDRFETIYENFVSGSGVHILGSPEPVTIIPGDRVIVYGWHDNRHKASVDVGFVTSCDLHQVFNVVSVLPAAGNSWGVETLQKKGPNSSFFAARLNPKAVGGYRVELNVKGEKGGPPIEVSFTQAMRQTGAGGSKVTYHEENIVNEAIEAFGSAAFEAALRQNQGASQEEVAQKMFKEARAKKDFRGFNEQGSFYGDLEGTLELDRTERLIAAPGSTAYHGSKIDRLNKREDRAAAFWVPIRVRVFPKEDISTFTVKAINPREPFIMLEVFSGTTKLKSHNLKNGSLTMDVPKFDGKPTPFMLQVVFLGGSATGVIVKGQ